MGRLFLVSVLLAGLVQNAALAAPQVKKPAAKKKGPARKKQPPRVDPTEGDNIDGDDLTVRRAAVAALGAMSGSVVAVDPNTGRILTMVNQKLGLKSGFVPCSTIKLVTALAALSEHIVNRDTFVFLGRHVSYNLTTAIARSNNQYFNILGTRLGFERVTRYARMLGLGEKAGLGIPGEETGELPAEPPQNGGVGMMTSFGEGIFITPLQLAALLSAIANGGTLYYLQYPRAEDQIEQFAPKIKRPLELASNGISDLKIGMRAAVDFGTAKRASDPAGAVLGKTGTCTDFRLASHMGWFGSFNDVGYHQLVVVVMLAGSKLVNGPVAAGVAGAIYRNLSEQRYFAAETARKNSNLPEIIATVPCCSR